MEKEPGGGNRAARLSHGLRIPRQHFHGLPDFVLRNCDDVVYIAANVLEVNGPNAL